MKNRREIARRITSAAYIHMLEHTIAANTENLDVYPVQTKEGGRRNQPADERRDGAPTATTPNRAAKYSQTLPKATILPLWKELGRRRNFGRPSDSAVGQPNGATSSLLRKAAITPLSLRRCWWDNFVIRSLARHCYVHDSPTRQPHSIPQNTGLMHRKIKNGERGGATCVCR